MPKLKQNIVFFIKPTDDDYSISLKAGNMSTVDSIVYAIGRQII